VKKGNVSATRMTRYPQDVLVERSTQLHRERSDAE
jgi:hypothetical protein